MHSRCDFGEFKKIKKYFFEHIKDLHTGLKPQSEPDSLIDIMLCSTVERLGLNGLIRHYTPGLEARHYAKCVMVLLKILINIF